MQIKKLAKKTNYFYIPWQITPASDLWVHAEFSVVAKVQLNREASKPVQKTPCKYTGFMFSINPPVAAMAPGIQSKCCLILSVIMSYHSLVKELSTLKEVANKVADI